jgi:signal transduction histidine kinase
MLKKSRSLLSMNLSSSQKTLLTPGARCFADTAKVAHTLQTAWINCSFRTKLAALLFVSAALPTGLVSYSLIHLAESQMHADMRASLQKDLAAFQQQQQQVEQNNALLAAGLAQAVETADIKLDQPEPTQQNQLNALVQSGEFKSSFYLITDAQGRVVTQKVQTIADASRVNESLATTPTAPTYRTVSPAPGTTLSRLSIVQSALRTQRPLSGHELVNAELLQQLGLTPQSEIGIRAQKTAGLPPAKQPLPQDTYNLEQGKVGLIVMAVQPIKQNNQVVGTAIVGTLLNRNTALVDTIRQETGVSTVTLFAYDWRISTNVPTLDGKSRAIGTRAAREVAETVLQQGKTFSGITNIVGQVYLTAYAPLYDHRHQLNPAAATPIGMIYVGNPDTVIAAASRRLETVGYSTGSGILLIVGLLALPIANALSSSLRRLTQFAQQVGQTVGVDTSLLTQYQKRHDEIGILAQELSQMTHRVETNLLVVQQSESQIRAQSIQLQQVLQEQQQTQAQMIQSEKMSALGQLVAGVAHEINNPVNFIHGNLTYVNDYTHDLLRLVQAYQTHLPEPSQALQEILNDVDLDFLSEDLGKLLQSMKVGTDRIRQIVLSLRNFSRLDESDFKAVDLHEGIDNTLLILQHRLKSTPERSIEIVRNYAQLPLIECYPGQINQVFMNLIANAIDALEESAQRSPRQSPCTIWISTQLEPENFVRITIADNGSGMPEDVRSHIFNPFFTTKPVGKGTGLGLSISYQIVTEKHHGTMACDSEPGAGTKFMIEIPIRQAAIDEQNEPKIDQQTPSTRQQLPA